MKLGSVPFLSTTSGEGPNADRLDQHWLNALLFTIGLVGLVMAAIGADIHFTAFALLTCAIGFGVFFFAIPGGLHFGFTLANFLAVYVSLFVCFRTTNFAEAPRAAAVGGLGLPVASFLLGCLFRRQRIVVLVRARRMRELLHMPRISRWVPGVAGIGLVSFLWPMAMLDPTQQGWALLGSMAVIAVLVGTAAQDVVMLLMDVALIFEGVTARVHRLMMPIAAFLTTYALLVVVFACLFRIAQFTSHQPQFTFQGHAARLDFTDALYFSLSTMATIGYGDIAPVAPLVRALAGIEVVFGVLLLLFGFSEIMRNAGPDVGRRIAGATEPAEPAADPVPAAIDEPV